MKKIFLMLLAIVAMAMIPSTMMAASFNDAAPLNVVKAGNISGTLDVQMGSHTNSFTNFSDLTVTENSDNTINFTITTIDATYLGVPFTAIVEFTQD